HATHVLARLFVPTPRPHRAPPFPYTTLFRSRCSPTISKLRRFASRCSRNTAYITGGTAATRYPPGELAGACSTFMVTLAAMQPRSEEHTSELQSREKLVCRLLLEKKNEGVPT